MFTGQYLLTNGFHFHLLVFRPESILYALSLSETSVAKGANFRSHSYFTNDILAKHYVWAKVSDRCPAVATKSMAPKRKAEPIKVRILAL